tara:strand:+ start:1810 stop:3102 length:1293 start_codon:yes stop_codon:yes gene_type:complete
MRKCLLILSLLLLPGVFAFSFMDAFSILDPFVTGSFSVNVSANAPVWNQSISNVTVNQDSGSTVVDSNMTLLGNGQCTDADGTTPTFAIESENTSAVDCTVSGTQISVTPASGFTGNSTCIVSCSDGINSTNSTFITTVNAVEAAPAEEPSARASGGGGGGGASFGPSISETGLELELITDKIEIELNRGQKATKTITVANYRNVSRVFETKVSGVASLVLIKDLVSAAPNTYTDIKVDFDIPIYYDLGIYSGSIDFEFGSVMIVVEVKDSKKDVDIELDLYRNESASPDLYVGQLELRSFYPGQTLKPTTDLSLFSAKGIDNLDIEFRIIDSSNQVVYSESVEDVSTAKEFTADITLPPSLLPGRYVLAVLTEDAGFTGSDYKTFEVLDKKPPFSDDFVIMLSVALAILAIFFILTTHQRARRYGRKSR